MSDSREVFAIGFSLRRRADCGEADRGRLPSSCNGTFEAGLWISEDAASPQIKSESQK